MMMIPKFFLKQVVAPMSCVRYFSIDRAIKVVKLGNLIKIAEGPHRVLKIVQGKRGKGGGFVKATLQHVFNGARFEKTFTSDESVEEAFYEKNKAQFSWEEGDQLVFLDSESFEEIRVDKKAADVGMKFVDGDVYKLMKCEGRYIGIELVKDE